jgi:hypothetical protein
MPQTLTVRIDRPAGRSIRIWIPILPVLLVLSPLLLLAALAALAACLVFHVNALRAFGTGWRIFTALSGTRIDIEQDRTAVLVVLR